MVARATSKLEQAGLIECQRHAGRLPRYRLKNGARSPARGVRPPPIQNQIRGRQGPICGLPEGLKWVGFLGGNIGIKNETA